MEQPRSSTCYWRSLLAATVLAAVGGAAWFLWPRPDVNDGERFASPYRNTQPGVQYVGSESCVACHVDIADDFGRHPMGRSLAPVNDAASRERYDAKPFKSGPLAYFVEKTPAGVK